ncbi:putative receptor protein-tyrosine kinase RLK-Pelle-LRR-XI-1 family [Helianthus annuus]|uniref:non-specific serine/threonine protein kinase n=1 Tax=Helianthus annuus TaxID=4232 RepID=A0A251VN73_HELAN|nr:leucine-rich repeat receptor-like tyrosine-protein kinase PXC3 [Helianthus annuus]KAF5821351.1 putative receptor protein-tyrosine kinase RLK-Pelle-LRR-XI-1 family [Helianthus annuus]KAJ0621938.1 putative receptor protein-tyrosine kinase RLK-Pelle-LRR-XI-1 family [Helianthus annuus]KAJ0626297.1 putative receptor protein-tyrosine kinase RLK-Pelle-LRR-XI-1 family [Helianthus annuus]KAJ0947263.1 putative receptor protein-tyrosine kinase RLK-Pelle-LRR-XI-1 family [Helianthus annuus]
MWNLWLFLVLTVGFLSWTVNSELINGDHEDLFTLVAIGKELKLLEWDENGLKNTSNYCFWPHITCSPTQSVEKLVLSHQTLQGNLTLLSELKSLKWLDLSYNTFHGSIPHSFGNLSHLEFLDLSYNKFDGSIPVELGQLKNLKSLNLSNNLLIGSIPNELQGLVKLQDLQLYTNHLNGSIPNWVGNLTNLRVFTAYENELRGKIPETLGAFSELLLLNLHSNYLQGSIPKSVFANGKLQFLVLTQNKLNGELPDSVGKCKDLSSIRIGDNDLIGNIPKEIGNLSSLTYFEADNNNLSGEIVKEFAQCSNLTLLNLASNGFSGIIPPVFGDMTNLQELIVSGNNLSGEIPASVLGNKNLNKIDLSNNRFNGSIPKNVCNSSRLQYLLLGQNSLVGEIPSEIGNCVKLLELQLGGNHLTGTIPPEIGRIKNLQIALNLSFNHLHGQLPPDLGKLDKLVSLDLSNNQLTGNIPSALKGMLSLIDVNFANNHLTGPIPTFAPFQKSPNSSFEKNTGLCGYPLNSFCGNSDGPESFHHKVSYRIVLAVIGSGLLVFLSVTIVVVLFMMREKQEKVAKTVGKEDEEIEDNNKPLVILGNVFVENLKQAIDFDAVVKATLKDSNKISSGTFSTIYKAEMPSGLTLSVKRLKSVDKTILHQQSKMIRELERLSNLCHDNLIRPIGFAIYDDVALLLHQFLPNGSLARFLHESSKEEAYKPDWPVRLSIAVGVAEGLAFLHHLAIIHLDISSGNIFLDSNFRPLVGEVEISKLLDPSRGTASISAVAGSFGYIPPEYAYTMQVTAPGNVYSFGVVLLEILTTRVPVDEEFGEGVDLVKWVQGAPTRGETPEQILDAKLSTVSFSWRKEMLSALKVALLCTDTTPAKRPKMKKVVEMLQEIITESK